MNNFFKRKRQRKRRSCWVKEWLNKRNSLSAYQMILNELWLNNAEYFRQYWRMNTEVYEAKRFLQPYYHYYYYHYYYYHYYDYYYYYYYYFCYYYYNTLLTNFWQVNNSIMNKWIRSQIFHFLLTNDGNIIHGTRPGGCFYTAL